MIDGLPVVRCARFELSVALKRANRPTGITELMEAIYRFAENCFYRQPSCWKRLDRINLAVY